MTTSSLKPTEISGIVTFIWWVRTVKEIDNQTFSEEVHKLCATTSEYSNNSLSESESTELIDAFLLGDPSKAFCRLAELRSGRSLCDRHSAAIDIENEQSDFSFIYCNFISSFLNAMSLNDEVSRAFLDGGCIEAALRELRSKEFIQHKKKSSGESRTAFANSSHLELIYSVSYELKLKERLTEELQRFGYIPILREYSRSAYVPFILNFSYFHISIILLWLLSC